MCHLFNRSPYEVLFGQRPLHGLERARLPKEVEAKLQTEEELEKILQQIQIDQASDESEAEANQRQDQTQGESRGFDHEAEREVGSHRVEIQRTTTEDREGSMERDGLKLTTIIEETENSTDGQGEEDVEDGAKGSRMQRTTEMSCRQNTASRTQNAKDTQTEMDQKNNGEDNELDCSDNEVEMQKSGATSVPDSRRFSGKNNSINEHLTLIKLKRTDASDGQKKSRNEMLQTANTKLQHLQLHDSVLLPVSEFDRGRLDCRNVPGLIIDVSNRGLYTVATKHGMVNTKYSRNQMIKADCVLLIPEDIISDVFLPFRRIAALHSKTNGQGFVKCLCTSNCSTKRCTCKRSGRMCHSHRHSHNTKCCNK